MGGGALGQDGGHHDVGRSGDGGLVQEHVGAAEFLGTQLEGGIVLIVGKFRAEPLESLEMGVEPPAADLVPSRLGGQGIAEAGEHRTGEHDGASERGVALEELRGAEIRRVYVLGAERVASPSQLIHLHAHILQEGDEVVDIQDVGYIVLSPG